MSGWSWGGGPLGNWGGHCLEGPLLTRLGQGPGPWINHGARGAGRLRFVLGRRGLGLGGCACVDVGRRRVEGLGGGRRNDRAGRRGCWATSGGNPCSAFDEVRH